MTEISRKPSEIISLNSNEISLIPEVFYNKFENNIVIIFGGIPNEKCSF